jgi:hypothetical protein
MENYFHYAAINRQPAVLIIIRLAALQSTTENRQPYVIVHSQLSIAFLTTTNCQRSLERYHTIKFQFKRCGGE